MAGGSCAQAPSGYDCGESLRPSSRQQISAITPHVHLSTEIPEFGYLGVARDPSCLPRARPRRHPDSKRRDQVRTQRQPGTQSCNAPQL